MPPQVALLLWFVLLLALFIFDPAKEPKVSAALWVPLSWIFFYSTRSPMGWLFGGNSDSTVQGMEEGSSGDALVYFIMLVLAVLILSSRSFDWGKFTACNAALIAFLLFGLVSVTWSDFSGIAFRRWFKDLGSYFMILVVLSDPNPEGAIRMLLRRYAYLMLPLSMLLIKYFPVIGRSYDPWTGVATYAGAATGKNLLSLAAMLCIVYFAWDTIVRWPDRKKQQNRRAIMINVALTYIGLWLMDMAPSATCNTCFVISLLVIFAAHTNFVKRHPAFLTASIPTFFLLYVILAFGFGLSGSFAQSIGKDPTLTGRTEIWAIVLGQQTSRLLGAGYESFWLGPRLLRIWGAGQGHLTESHNGYLEIYLNLGFIGTSLLGLFLISSYRVICRRLKPFSSIGSLTLALFTITLFYCTAEAGFRSGLMWHMLLLSGLSVPVVKTKQLGELASLRGLQAADKFLSRDRRGGQADSMGSYSPWTF